MRHFDRAASTASTRRPPGPTVPAGTVWRACGLLRRLAARLIVGKAPAGSHPTGRAT